MKKQNKLFIPIMRTLVIVLIVGLIFSIKHTFDVVSMPILDMDVITLKNFITWSCLDVVIGVLIYALGGFLHIIGKTKD